MALGQRAPLRMFLVLGWTGIENPAGNGISRQAGSFPGGRLITVN